MLFNPGCIKGAAQNSLAVFTPIFLALFCFFLFTSPPDANAQTQNQLSQKMAEISKVLMKYEMALSWLEQCNDLERQLKAYPNFGRSAQAVVMEMTKQVKLAKPNVPNLKVERVILKARRDIAELADKKLARDGCDSLHANEAKALFEDLRTVGPTQTLKQFN